MSRNIRVSPKVYEWTSGPFLMIDGMDPDILFLTPTEYARYPDEHYFNTDFIIVESRERFKDVIGAFRVLYPDWTWPTVE